MKRCYKCKEHKPFSNFSKSAERADGYASICKACSKKALYAWRLNNPEKNKIIVDRYQAKVKELIPERQRQSYLRRRASILAKKKVYYAMKKEEFIARNALRNAAMLKRTPSWLTSDDYWVIKEVYALATLRAKHTGLKWHVDHIIPLQGKTVCGLHVPANLQVIPAVINNRKYNHYEEAS